MNAAKISAFVFLALAFNGLLPTTATFGQSVGDQAFSEQRLTELKTRLQKALDVITEQEDFPGASLAVVLPSEQVVEISSGYEDPISKVKLMPGARMFCGSTGKTFVSAAVLRLIDAGRIKLDGKALDYFDLQGGDKWMSSLPNSKSITIRSLLNHTSGMPRYLFQKRYLEDLKTSPYRKRSPREGLQAVAGLAAVHEVGKGWSYSDTNYLLLGLIVEKVTGKKYYDYADEQFLKPLKLISTTPAIKPEIKDLVLGHIGSNNFFGLPVKTVSNGRYVMDPSFEWCGGGYVTNSRDLAVWLHAVHSGNILPKKIHQQLVSPVDFKKGKPSQTGYGLGSFVWNTPQGLYFGHAGVMPGYLTQIEYSKDHDFSIALQTNTDEGLGRHHHQVLQKLAKLVVESL